MKIRIAACLGAFLLVAPLEARAGVFTVATVDPLLGAPILYDSGGAFIGTPSLDPLFNGGLTISGIEVLGPGAVFTTTDDGLGAADTTVIQLNASAGPGTNAPVGAPAALTNSSRGYDLTLNPVSGLLGVAATAPGGGGPGTGLAAIYELDPGGVFAPAVYAPLPAPPTTSGLTYGPGAAVATLSTDGVVGALTPAPMPGGIYAVPAGGPAGPGILDAAAPPFGVGSPGDDHVVTLDGRTIFLNDGAHDMQDVTAGGGGVFPMVDLDLIPAVAPFLAAGGVRGAVNPFDGDIFTGWGAGGPNLIRVDSFGATASVAVVGFDNVRDIAFGPSTLAPAGPLASGFSLYVTEIDFTTGPGTFSNIWEIGILVPEPSTIVLGAIGLLSIAGLALRRKFAR